LSDFDDAIELRGLAEQLVAVMVALASIDDSIFLAEETGEERPLCFDPEACGIDDPKEVLI
jgi:hypothetical protein